MNTNRLIPILLAAAGLMASGCDSVGPDDRFDELPAVEAKRVVLLEEFTGQMCINCPKGHEVIAYLVKEYPDNFIPVSIHSGGEAFSIGETQYEGVVGLRNDEGEQYATDNNVKKFPCGIVDRTSGILDKEDWTASVIEHMAKPAIIDIDVDATLTTDGAISIATTVDAHSTVAANLQLWVCESGITAMQLQPDGMPDVAYVHNHVFRAAVNGHDGEPFSIAVREQGTFTNTIALSPRWNPENLSVVAFAYNSTGVLQAAHAKVKMPVD